MLDFYVGQTARQQIEKNGLTPDLFDVFLGASGGPKWFTLFGLDKYVFGEFFKNRKKPLDLVGSSAGAFRSACFTQNDPVKAITELATRYSQTDVGDKPTPESLTRQASEMLEHIFSADGIEQLLNNPVFKAHFIVAKTRGLETFENKWLQGAGLVKSYSLNRISRKMLSNRYQRFIFGTSQPPLTVYDEAGFKSTHLGLNALNIKPALLASGSIPLVMAGIKNIPGAPKGMYRDGGIIDYHFDIQFNRPGLVLYPHFNSAPKAGWFDKSLKRSVSAASYNKTLMLAPKSEFIRTLPYSKIPDRTDFDNLAYKERLTYWRTVFSETERLAEELHRVIETQDLSVLKPYPS